MKLYAHPFSSYCQKALIALYENGTSFELRLLSPDHPENAAEHETVWPLKRFPVLTDGARTLMEATIIVEYLDLRYPGPARLLPEDPLPALDVRLLDRIFDNYVMTPMQKIVGDSLRPADRRDAHGVGEARQLLEQSYAWLENTLGERTWANGDAFSLADCAAAPARAIRQWRIFSHRSSMFTFIEAAAFERFRPMYLDDDESAVLQQFMISWPEAGDVVPGSGEYPSKVDGSISRCLRGTNTNLSSRSKRSETSGRKSWRVCERSRPAVAERFGWSPTLQ